jgi:hypothetical protein
MVNYLHENESEIILFIFLVKIFISEIKHSRFRRNDFEAIKTIGRGAFGEGI